MGAKTTTKETQRGTQGANNKHGGGRAFRAYDRRGVFLRKIMTTKGKEIKKMAHVKVKGVIYYKVKKNHPDLKYIPEDERDKTHEFRDVYNIDTDQFWGRDHIESYIKHDLRLVAGGGYDTDTIKNTKIVLIWGVA